MSPWFVIFVFFVVGCAHPMPYAAPTPPPAAATFQESANWKPASPRDTIPRGAWWEKFGDARLDDLEARVDVSNETLKAAAARFDQARALVRQARSNLYPQVTASPGVAALQPSGNRAVSAFHDSYVDIVAPVDATYEVDAWGRVRGTVNANIANAQATAADLETIRLSLHAELATDYFELEGIDREEQLLQAAVDAYQRALMLTQTRFQGGIASGLDVAQAETQLETTRAQAADIEIDRAALEHAIAVLTGGSPSAFALPDSPLTANVPDIGIGVPSELLERRADIAAAERRVAAASAQVGVARSAFYPILTLSGSAGFESSTFGRLITGTGSLWSLGASALVNVFDAGRRRAVTAQAEAAYDEASATYRESVLTAFRDVEDELASLRVLQDEAAVQDRATAAAERSLMLANNRYVGGVASYLEVITAQSAALASERASASILTRRMTSSVNLLKALGGGWDAGMLPAASQVSTK